MKYPVHLVKKIEEHTNVTAAEMLGYLLQLIRGAHRLHAGVFADDPARRRDVFDDIQTYLKQARREDDPPVSILALLDLVVEVDQAGNAFMAANFSDAKRKQLLEKHNADLNALRLIFRELMNDAEHDGISTAVQIDDQNRS